ncbi:MAG: class II SORL domain-containing protein [Candidatus Lokiarchaeota archaeon]|nr:class II SORL domain-containing protein [Candidatus Lokiarchaeota archaeon]
MVDMNEFYQSADWKSEKHVPVLSIEGPVKKGEWVKVSAQIGKEIGHPNKTEHHIAWIKLFFHPKGEKYPYEIGQANFNAHGASVQGPDTSSIYTHHQALFMFKTDKPGTLIAESYCNIHGVWKNEHEISF